MGLKDVLRRSNTLQGAAHDMRVVRSRLKSSPRKAIARYMASHSVRKLQLGAGPTELSGWLATDIEPLRAGVVYLDATRPFPIADASFDYVFSEHMIEHVAWTDGLTMLRECARILKSGGRLRVATPDLAVILGLYADESPPAAQTYVRWITDQFLPDVGTYRPAFVINNAFRYWGHQFLYDGELMETGLAHAGFVDIRRCRCGESEDPELRSIESHGQSIADQEINLFESMVYEATKPR